MEKNKSEKNNEISLAEKADEIRKIGLKIEENITELTDLFINLHSIDSVLISRKRYGELLINEGLIRHLKNHGVEKWDGYENAENDHFMELES